MEERELVALIENEVTNAIGGSGAGGGGSSHSSILATERAMELDYYNGQPLGNERDGESQVVSSDVFDAVEGMLPHLLKTFTASDDAVEFEPVGEEDEEAAKQRTDVCNYVFYKQNNGFLLMYEWFKDALLQKNGVVKYWWEEKEDISEDEWEGLTEGEYLKLMQDDDVEVLAHTAYDDPIAVDRNKELVKELSQVQDPRAQMMLAQIKQAPLPQVHDIKVKITRDVSQICIEAVPPEEFGISAKQKSISIQNAPFCYQRKQMTYSELREMGCPKSVIDEMGSSDQGDDLKPEVLARNRFIDESANSETADDSLKQVWVVDCFIRLDYDGDGKAELRHIIMPGRTIWINEPASHINYAAITPIIMPHRWIGKSIAEVVMDVQFITSVLWRQMLNNLYLTNNPRKAVLSSSGGIVQANLDDLLDSRPGGIVREYVPNAVRDMETPFVAGASFPMIEYMQGVKEQRTGNTRYNQGTDADSLNKTARGIQLIQTAAQQKIDLIARIFAETGVKDLFRGIAYLLSKYSSRKMTLRIRNQWVDIDPRAWKNQFDMTINVGLGTGNKDAQLVHLSKMNEVQIELMKEGRGYMVTDQNVYNLQKKMAENMGFKHPDLFITDPTKVQKPPPQPNPDLIKIQQADQESKLKIQSTEKIRQFDAQTQKEVETIKAQTLITLKQMEIAAQESLKKIEIEHAAQLAVFQANNTPQPQDDTQLKLAIAQGERDLEVWKTQLVEANKLKIAEVGATKELMKTEMQAESDANIALTTAVNSEKGAVTQKSVKPLDDLKKQNKETAEAHNKSMGQLATVLTGVNKALEKVAESGEETAKAAKAPRKHKIQKVGDGYEITSTVQ